MKFVIIITDLGFSGWVLWNFCENFFNNFGDFGKLNPIQFGTESDQNRFAVIISHVLCHSN
jgi:hypothetical protein